MQGLVEPAKGASKGLTLRYMGLRQADWVERSNETMMKISLDRCQHQVYGYPDNRYRKEGMKVGGQRNLDRPKRCFLSEKSTDSSSRIVLVLAFFLGKSVANRSTTLVIFFFVHSNPLRYLAHRLMR